MRTMPIERLLTWAYCEELPKAGATGGELGFIASPMGRVKDVADLGALVDVNRYGVVPIMGLADDEPHPDALLVAEAVDGLTWLEVEAFDVDDLAADMIHLGEPVRAAAGEARRVLVRRTEHGRDLLPLDAAVLVRRYAMVGGAPAVRGVMPKLVDATGPQGHPVWRKRVSRAVQWDAVTGEAIRFEEVEVDVPVRRGTGGAPDGAYRVQVLQPDPLPVFVERLTYAVWRAALDWLAAELDGRLATVTVLPSGRAAMPWFGEEDALPPRVLIDRAQRARESVDRFVGFLEDHGVIRRGYAKRG